MELLERYLQAIRWWLPRGADREVVAELADDLQSQIEERESGLGRKLTEDEVAAILRRCGHPLTVAGRLLPGRSFLSPALSVVYGFVLRIVLLGVYPALLLLLLVPAFVAGHDPLGALVSRLGSAAQSALVTCAVITAIFVLVDRHQGRLGIDREWEPRRLPKLRDTRRIPRSDSAAGIVVGILFLAWWTGVASPPVAVGRLRDVAAWTEAWKGFRPQLYVPVLLCSLGGLALSVVALLRPYWTRARLFARLAVDGALLAALLAVLRPHAGDLFTLLDRLRAGRHTLAADPAIGMVARLGILWAIAWVAIAVAIAVGVTLFRLATWREGDARSAPARRA